MFRKWLFVFTLLTSAGVAGGPALAEDGPSLHQVYQAAQAGKLDEAQGMMDKVLQEHPNSGKAHFVEAELMAKQGRLPKAEAELGIAERLSPGLPFAKPQAVQELKNRISSSHRNSQASENGFQPQMGGGFPWGMVLLGVGVIALILLAIRALKARSATAMPPGYIPNGYAPAAQPYGGGGAPMAPVGGGIGSGIMGGLATGVAVGAGMVAGEALAHHFMDGNHGEANAAPVQNSWGSSGDDMGGADFGVADNSSWDNSAGVADSMDVGGDDWS